MDYDEKKRWLWRYQESLREEQLLEEEIEQLQAEAERVTPCLTGVPGGGSGQGDKLPKAVEKILEEKHRLMKQIVETQSVRREIIAVVDGVKDSKHREILRRRYLLGQRWEEIACAMHMAFRWVTKQHHKAIQEMQIQNKEAPQSPIKM